MRSLLQTPGMGAPGQAVPLWLVLHGAGATAEQAMALFGDAAAMRGALVLAPQATRPCGEGYCWSFARDATAIGQLLDHAQEQHAIDPARIMLIGYSMGCAMGCWLLAHHPARFAFFAAIGMGSAFEPWEHDDGGIDQAGLQASAAMTPALLAVDQADPAGTHAVFAANLHHLRAGGRRVAVFRPNEATHAVTPAIKTAVLHALQRA